MRYISTMKLDSAYGFRCEDALEYIILEKLGVKVKDEVIYGSCMALIEYINNEEFAGSCVDRLPLRLCLERIDFGEGRMIILEVSKVEI